MLSRAQEARVRAVLVRQSLGATPTYCLEHLATVAEIPQSHLADLAAFVRSLREHGDCQTRYGGVCEAKGHETKHLLVRGPSRQQTMRQQVGP